MGTQSSTAAAGRCHLLAIAAALVLLCCACGGGPGVGLLRGESRFYQIEAKGPPVAVSGSSAKITEFAVGELRHRACHFDMWMDADEGRLTPPAIRPGSYPFEWPALGDGREAAAVAAPPYGTALFEIVTEDDGGSWTTPQAWGHPFDSLTVVGRFDLGEANNIISELHAVPLDPGDWFDSRDSTRQFTIRWTLSGSDDGGPFEAVFDQPWHAQRMVFAGSAE